MEPQNAAAELERGLSELQSLALWLEDEVSARRVERLRRLLTAVAEPQDQPSGAVPAQWASPRP